MAECMDEFDEATPLRGTYCSRLTSEEYEEQGARWGLIRTTTLVSRLASLRSVTEQALQELMGLLDNQPELYKAVLKKRRRERREEEGFMAYVKVSIIALLPLLRWRVGVVTGR